MSSCAVHPYDAVPYASHPIPPSHPARMATMAALLSLTAPPVATARVLELGCAAAGNLIPLACNYPESNCVGVDSSKVQISAGRRCIEVLGLVNIQLRQANILDVDSSWGEFDFIVCHGVYSWVPPQVQDKILNIASEMLSPDGIAYISYNTYPGWHLRGVVRNLMRYGSRHLSDPEQAVAEARHVLDVVSKHTTVHDGSAYARLLKAEAELMPGNSDHYIYHEHLEEQCGPLYFHEFIRRAASKSLTYLGETSLAEMATADLGPRANRAISTLARNPLEAEQYMDFLCNRMFRKTLLRRSERTPSYDVPSRNLWTMYIASGLRPESLPVDFLPGASSTFVNRAGDSITTALPLLKAALLELAEHWPAGISFESLLNAACTRLAIEATELQRIVLSQALLSVLKQSESIEVSLEPPRFTVCPSEMPTASRLARHQAAATAQVTNFRHESVELSPKQQRVIQAMDGSFRVADLVLSARLSPEDVQNQISQLARLALIVD